jgi:hypothetical protein
VTEFSEIRQAFATNLEALNVDESWIEVSPYAIPDPGFRMPVIMVWGIDDEEGVTFDRGTSDMFVVIRAVTGTMVEVPPQQTLDRLLMGELDVTGLIESDRTLGGLVDDLFVANMTGHREFPQGSSRVLGAEWRVRLILSS